MTLVELYKQQRGSQEAEQLAAALTEMARSANFEELVDLARDGSLGRSRVLLLDGLVKSGRLRARPVMEELVDDPDVRAEATAQLRRLQRMSKK
ncbi:hypothetical protein [Microbacterium sp. SLBN-146]|uniref:hypothetical protein n=1 Tax=Microbacterium sp. SLBN-146 TaxID=2768457 RepID=UPI001151F7B4|nr:hypothetical protein [Microbacterium sp. SLBN-146]